jgi:glycerol transport system substrate-binding protein
MRKRISAVAMMVTAISLSAPAFAGMDEAKKWVESEFQPSALSKDEQLKEMEWFVKAAEPLKGLEVNVLSETIPTHTYESETLAKAFFEITGIKVNHQLLGEGEVVQAVQTQMQTNRNLYDGYINDSDLIGTHSRLQSAVNLSDWMAGEGKDVTNPGLDTKDFIGAAFTTGPDGKLWQLPDQQFANLYWFRKDWFDRKDIQDKFKAKYGYDLGVPVNWSAYEDIADFFTNDVKEIDGVKVYGRPIDEWGIRMEAGSCNPSGASVTRGGGTNAPASVYAIAKWDEWLRKYAPPGAADYDFYQSLPSLSQGNVAQQIFWYTAFTASMVAPKKDGNNTVNDAGEPLWRMAPSPHGPYWKDGMKLGYQDAGSWTFFKSTPVDRRKAAWLYAQFVVSKTVDTKKSHVGLTFIRDSTVNHASFTERAPKLGGLIEFYRSPDRVNWTPTGVNVPDYPKLAQLWWQQIGDVNSGAFTPQQAMDRLAGEMDLIMSRMEEADKKSKTYGGCGPRLNEPKKADDWLGKADGPAAKLANEKEKGQTIAYDELIKRWTKK